MTFKEMWLVKEAQIETSEVELGGDTTPLSHTVAVTALGCGDSLGWPTAHATCP